MARLDEKLDALNVRMDHLETYRDESDPESECLFWLNGQYGTIAFHLQVIHHEILWLTDEAYAAEVSKLEEDLSELDAESAA